MAVKRGGSLRDFRNDYDERMERYQTRDKMGETTCNSHPLQVGVLSSGSIHRGLGMKCEEKRLHVAIIVAVFAPRL